MDGAFQGGAGLFTALNGVPFHGYEIHMGETAYLEDAVPLSRLTCLDRAEKLDGAARGNVWGSYVHGIFDSGAFAQALVNALLSAKGLTPDAAAVDWETYQEEQYDKLAAGVRASLDMDRIYGILNGEE